MVELGPSPAGAVPPTNGSLHINSNRERALVGALGGFAAVLVKYISQDHAAVASFLATHSKAGLPFSAITDIVGGYFILAPMIIALGAIIGWVSNEDQRIKLFALGVSAPALITTLSSGNSVKVSLLELSSAYAQSVQGVLGSFFGSSDRPYAIYVGSFSNQTNIDRILNTINNETKSLHAITSEVTDKDGKKFQRIYVLQLFGLKEALDVRDKLLLSKVVDMATITKGTSSISADN
jgi:hypothetical protein